MAVDALVSCEWLKQQLDDNTQNLTLIESTWKPRGKNKDVYLQERIPGAKFFDMWEGVHPTSSFSRPLPDLNVFTRQLERLGVSGDTHVVVYDRGAMKYAARMWLQCKEIGLEKISVLDGGLANWKAHGYTVDSGENEENQTHSEGRISINRQPQFCDFQEMSNIVRAGSHQIVDTRDPDYFRGDSKEPSPSTQKAYREMGMPTPMMIMRGHMRGARNVFYEHLLDASTCCFKTEQQLRQLFGDAGVDVHARTVSSCYNGQTACLVPLAAAKLGADTHLHLAYAGSWTEFGQRALASDIETGKAASKPVTSVIAETKPTDV